MLWFVNRYKRLLSILRSLQWQALFTKKWKINCHNKFRNCEGECFHFVQANEEFSKQSKWTVNNFLDLICSECFFLLLCYGTRKMASNESSLIRKHASIYINHYTGLENYMPLENNLSRKLAHLSNDRLMKWIYRNRMQFTRWNRLEIPT